MQTPREREGGGGRAVRCLTESDEGRQRQSEAYIKCGRERVGSSSGFKMRKENLRRGMMAQEA
jgi:hypothetical protein